MLTNNTVTHQLYYHENITRYCVFQYKSGDIILRSARTLRPIHNQQPYPRDAYRHLFVVEWRWGSGEGKGECCILHSLGSLGHACNETTGKTAL